MPFTDIGDQTQQAPVNYVPSTPVATSPSSGGGGSVIGGVPSGMYVPQGPLSIDIPSTSPFTPAPLDLNLGAGGSSPAYTNSLTRQQAQDMVLTDPRYTQGLEWLNQQKALLDQQAANEAARLKQQQAWYEQEYGLAQEKLAQARSAAQSAGSVGNSDEAYYAQLDALQKEQAAHQKALMEEYIREALGSRGMASSGQTAWEQQEQNYSYSNLIREIDLRAQARRAAAADAAAARNRSIANQLAELELQGKNLALDYQKGIAQFGWQAEDAALQAQQLEQQFAQKKGELLMQVADYIWNENSQSYVNSLGQTY